MSIQKTITKDFEILDQELARIETQTKNVQEMANKGGDEAQKNFINAIRDLYVSRQGRIAAGGAAIDEIYKKIKSEDRTEENIRRIINKINIAQNFSTHDLADELEKSFDNFLLALNIQVRYHTQFKLGFNTITSNINKRKMIISVVKDVFNKPAFETMTGSSSLAHLRNNLKLLAETRYDALLTKIRQLDALFAEFNTILYKIYRVSSEFDMIKGIELDVEKSGLLKRIFGKKEEIKPLSFALTDRDKIRIKAIQGMTHQLHNTTVQAIRGKQKDVFEELSVIKDGEVAIRTILRKSFVRGEQRLILKAA